MHNYLIECKYYNLVKDKVLELKDKHNISSTPTTYYDLSDCGISNVLDDCNTFGLFSSTKVIVVDNLDDKSVLEDDFLSLIKYLNNPMNDVLLILCCNKLDDRKKITKNLKSSLSVVKIDINISDFIKSKLVGYKINSSVINKLVDFSCNDFDKVSNDIEILKSYKVNDKIILVEDIEEIITKKLGDSNELVFELSRSIANHDKVNALRVYKELLGYNIEPISIISLIASTFRIMYQVKVLSRSGLNSSMIASKLGEKSSYRITKTMEVINNYSKDEVFKIIKSIADTDLLMKSSDQDNKYLLEMFILNI